MVSPSKRRISGESKPGLRMDGKELQDAAIEIGVQENVGVGHQDQVGVAAADAQVGGGGVADIFGQQRPFPARGTTP